MKRSVKISLKFATAKKLRRLDHLLRRLRALTNRYIAHVWKHDGALDAATLNAVECEHLSYRLRSDCLKNALEIIASTRLSAKALNVVPALPTVSKSIQFSSLTATVEKGKGSFDYVLKISGTVPGKRIVLPFKSHRVLNKWLAIPGGKLLNGCQTNGTTATLWVDVPDLPVTTAGDEIGIDIGYNKLLDRKSTRLN